MTSDEALRADVQAFIKREAVGSQLLEIQRTRAVMRPELQKRPGLSNCLTRI